MNLEIFSNVHNSRHFQTKFIEMLNKPFVELEMGNGHISCTIDLLIYLYIISNYNNLLSGSNKSMVI